MAPPPRSAPATRGPAIAVLALAAPVLIGAADIGRLRIPVAPDGAIGVASTEALPPLHFNASVLVGYGHNPLVWRFEDGTYEPLIEHQLVLDAMVTVGIIRFIDLSVGIPVLLYQEGVPHDPSDPDPENVDLGRLGGSAVGDLRVIPRVQLADELTFGFGASFESEFTFNTGQLLGARRRYFGESGFAWRPRVVASLPLSFARLIASVGLRVRGVTRSSVADTYFDHEWEYHLASEIFILRDAVPLSALVELSGATAIGFGGPGQDALELLGGARVRVADRVVLTAGLGLGLTTGIGTPTARALLGVAWAPEAEDADGDGVPDDLDACPYDAEDRDGFDDDDGCPEVDNDEDGRPDSRDKCPNEPEDFNGFEDDDGCPDGDRVDSDEDGVPDHADRCPTAPEDIDAFKDEDGCPELDNDIDGVADADDQCPSEKETINGIDDYDGCPDEGEGLTELVETKIEIKETILFESGKAIIKQESKRVLDQVALQILAHPNITMVRIEGHTDDRGPDEDNLFLSQDRADAVRRYLIERGVDSTKLEATGFGETVPIDTNDTFEGRARNRRVEFVIIESTTTEIEE